MVECQRLFEMMPASLLVLELTNGNVKSIIEVLPDFIRQYAQARFLVLGERDCRPYEWLVRESGASEAIFSPRQATQVIRVIEAHFRSIPSNQETPKQRIFSRLPWKSEVRQRTAFRERIGFVE